ncbi:flagellar motor switch protein FliG [Roseovarius salinarum]|uniref:flagellar motor switch protein FliG n=1 Tax=Roseovarius salinarum TaxID=1981892 RepID=UPI000C3294F3|nr:FliG C-terminal domain-containing protein [Roseovarius salinarum]
MSRSNNVAQIAPPREKGAAARLTRKQKAAIIVRFLLNEGADVPLSDLPDGLQADLTTQMGAMRYVDRATLAEVVAEFAGELESLGLTFPRGVSGALAALDGRISPLTAARLRREAGVRQTGDPWDQVRDASLDVLAPIAAAESPEIAAVILSKLDVDRAAALLAKLPGERARRITYAVSQTQSVTPEAVDRIGLSIAGQIADIPDTAFADGPEKRVGEILNSSTAEIRDAVLSGLEETDGDFASRVRRAIFTFADIPRRLEPLDVPKMLRGVEQPTLVAALGAARDEDTGAAAEFLFENMSRRMADALREEIDDAGPVKPREGEAAMTEVVNAIRRLEAAGELRLRTPEDDASDDADDG